VAHPQIAAFARLAEGGARPTRKIEGQTTRLARRIHSIYYDEIHDEIFVPQPFSQSVVVFRGAASGEELPLRMIQGPSTQIKGADKLTVDPVHNEIFVAELDSILVFPREANGNVAPLRVLKGPDTGLNRSFEVAVDPVHNVLIVGISPPREPGVERKNMLLMFNRTDQGNTKPRSEISGPRTFLTDMSRIAVYPPKGFLLVAIPGSGTGPGEAVGSEEASVGIWSIEDKGDVPPRWTIGGPKGMLRQPRGVALDPKNKTVIISDKFLNAVLTYSFPEIF